MMLAFGLLAGLFGAVVASLQPPVPGVHDEFAYLLSGETFASGRVTNPTHPHWESFESFHIIHQPSYNSKYPPAQGLLLALGQVLFGNLFAGVCISMALATAACYWALLGWVPRRWANLGGLVLLLNPSFLINWGQSYWGGSVATLGGALLVGATFRLMRHPQTSHALLMALGALILANSRPYEGAVACLVCGAWVLLSWSRSHWPDTRTLWLRLAAPFAIAMASGATLMLAYNYQVTGDPLKLPYVVHEAEYGMAPLFLWQDPHLDRTYRHPRVHDYHNGWSMDCYRNQQTVVGLLKAKRDATRHAIKFFFPLPIAAVLLASFWLRGRRIRAPFNVLLLAGLASIISVWSWPHYLAPLFGPLSLVLIVWGLRNVDSISRRWQGNSLLLFLLVGLQAFVFANSTLTYLREKPEGWQYQRAAFIEQLEASPDKDLIFVRYPPNYLEAAEWVYNHADIDGAEVVWARERGEPHDQALVEYFSDRKIWLLEPADSDLPWNATTVDQIPAASSGVVKFLRNYSPRGELS